MSSGPLVLAGAAAGVPIGAILGNIDRLPRVSWRWLRGLDWRDVLLVISPLVMLGMGLGMMHTNDRANHAAEVAAANAEQTKALASQTVQLTNELKQCTADFQNVLLLQSQLGLATDEFTLDVSDASLSYQDTIARPPADIAQLPVDSPRRQAWFHGASTDYHRVVAPLNDARHKAIDDRKTHPYPPPLCGK